MPQPHEAAPSSLPGPLRALLIWNPAAGNFHQQRTRAERAGRLAAALRRGGWHVDLAATEAAGGATPAAERGIREQYRVLIACGGDGTLHEIVQTLARAAPGTAPALAVAPPFGTANIFAHAVECPRQPEAAARWLLGGRVQRLALGRAEREDGGSIRYFLAVASVGVDAAAVHRLRPQEKRRWGKAAYLASLLRTWPRYFPALLEYESRGGRGTADGIVVGLTRYYGGRWRLGRVAAGGSIALAVRNPRRLWPWQVLWMGLRGLEHAPGVERLPEGTVRITTPGRPLELDGEAAGETPVTLAVEAAGIQVLAGSAVP